MFFSQWRPCCRGTYCMPTLYANMPQPNNPQSALAYLFCNWGKAVWSSYTPIRLTSIYISSRWVSSKKIFLIQKFVVLVFLKYLLLPSTLLIIVLICLCLQDSSSQCSELEPDQCLASNTSKDILTAENSKCIILFFMKYCKQLTFYLFLKKCLSL